MWIWRKTYDLLMERIGDLERHARDIKYTNEVHDIEIRQLREQANNTRDKFRLLIDHLGLVHEQVPAKERFVKKGGYE